tara:strand:- start:36258 stop:37181 length:924 start_codon:yes stop_codon:yes gene_type:complete
MAVRTPLYYDNGNIREISAAQKQTILDECAYQYGTAPSVTLSRVSSGGNLGTQTDTRLQAGSYSSNSTSFPGSGTTANPTTVSVNYACINLNTTGSLSNEADTNNIKFPIYYDGGNFKAMTQTDMMDTFIFPAIDQITTGSTTYQQGGAYFLATSNSVSGATLVDGNPVFIDTRANTGAYTAAGIPEALDQPFTVTSFYIHKQNGNAQSYPEMLTVRSDNDLQQISNSSFSAYLKTMMRYAAVNSTSSRITYNINGTGNTIGTAIANTVLNGSTYTTNQVGDDYRAQEFPGGSVTTGTTWYLKITQY